jgi:flagellar capping protein FliD
MQSSDNKAISKVIQDFVDTWNNITVETASCIGTVVKQVN